VVPPDPTGLEKNNGVVDFLAVRSAHDNLIC